jgi:hypothetical protein
MPAVGEALSELNQHDDYSMVQVFEALRAPLLALDDLRPNGTSRFMLLIGRGYMDVQGHLRWFITTRYSEVLKLFTDLVTRASPEMSPTTLFWRLHFTLGTCVFTMASSQALTDIAFNDYGQVADSTVVINQLIPYLAAGVAAD